ncbi:glutathione S-transferase [Aliiglaciecola sp. LCG003]|uniref:glutathione S-transferase n=1 Tax=Aliiglaciecola sp. LCG003 TaxID=3053655 RepID=UPI0025726C03|nr:glutathione S-transferase [Aliiglaciecola sp. LCG003]WJG10051.1 glutathione S-transferase [Aliiglaciecola sp. LCG003]
MTLPVLYSLRNCPYAMRARLAIFKSKQSVELRDVVLKDKPAEMLAASPKGTVPILVLASSKVIDESLDIMLWALTQSDPNNLLRTEVRNSPESVSGLKSSAQLAEILSLINRFDHEFKTCLEAYKCAKRYHESNLLDCRQACEVYIQDLEQRLNGHNYLIDDKESLADIALLPFIRQFAKVERQWYLQSPYPQLKAWLNQYLHSRMFTKVMAKYPLWSSGQSIVEFGDI